MTTTTATYPHHVPPEALNATLQELLKQGGRTSAELADEVGYSIATVRARMITLENTGAVYRTAQSGPAGVGMTFIWHLGHAVPVDQVTDDGEKPVPGEVPRRTITRSYPAVGRRDALVAALFGPAKPPGLLTGILLAER